MACSAYTTITGPVATRPRILVFRWPVGIGTSRLSDDTWTAFGLALVPGVAKELYDATRDCNRFSWKDMAWNAAGAYVGVRTGNWLLGPSGVSYRMAF
jgi:hypothetical protein